MIEEGRFITRGIIPGRYEKGPDYYDKEYFSSGKATEGIQFPQNGSYLNPESEYCFKFQDLLRWIEGYISNGKILDVGCGPGRLAYWSNKLKRPFTIIGCDISETILRLNLINPNDYINVIVSSASYLPFISEQFDGILFSDILEHLSPEHAYSAVKDAYRLLKNKGRIFIKVPNRDTWSMADYNDQGHVWLPSLEEVHDLLQIGGFNNETVNTFTRGFPLSQTIRRMVKKDLRFPYFGRAIFATAKK